MHITQLIFFNIKLGKNFSKRFSNINNHSIFAISKLNSNILITIQNLQYYGNKEIFADDNEEAERSFSNGK